MQESNPSKIHVQISLVGTGVPSAPPVDFAHIVKTELTGVGMSQIEEVTAQPEPQGAKVIGEIIAVASVLLAAGDVYGKSEPLVRALRQLQTLAANTGRLLRVRMAGEEIDLSRQTAEQIAARVSLQTRGHVVRSAESANAVALVCLCWWLGMLSDVDAVIVAGGRPVREWLRHMVDVVV